MTPRPSIQLIFRIHRLGGEPIEIYGDGVVAGLPDCYAENYHRAIVNQSLAIARSSRITSVIRRLFALAYCRGFSPERYRVTA